MGVSHLYAVSHILRCSVNFVIIFISSIFFTDNEIIMNEKLFLNDKNYDINLLTFLSTNINESKMSGRDDLGRDSFRKNPLNLL